VVQAVVLTLAIGYWPTPREQFPALFQAGAQAALTAAGAHVQLSAAEAAGPPGDAAVDTAMDGYRADGTGPVWRSQFSALRLGWWPAAGLLALLLATPMGARARLLALGGGLALLALLALGRLGLEIAYLYSELERGPGGPAQGLVHLLLRVGSESLTATIPTAAGVFVVWVLVGRPWSTLDLSALQTLLGLSRGAPRKAQEAGGGSSEPPDPS
jgi:hypothetical protein